MTNEDKERLNEIIDKKKGEVKPKATKKAKRAKVDIKDTLDYRKFNELGLKYTIESVMFLADHNRTMNDAINFYGKADNIVYLVGAGLKEKSIENAMEAINKLMENGICLEVLYCLCVAKARENGFFINERGLNTLNAMSDSENLMNNQEILGVILKSMEQYQMEMNVANQLI